jgi:hypothetical protein
MEAAEMKTGPDMEDHSGGARIDDEATEQANVTRMETADNTLGLEMDAKEQELLEAAEEADNKYDEACRKCDEAYRKYDEAYRELDKARRKLREYRASKARKGGRG